MTLTAKRWPAIAAMTMIVASLATALPIPAAAAALVAVNCPYQDNSGGVGGQEGTCTFRCDATDTIHLKVDGKDADAMVSGTGQCGGGHLTCGPQSLTCSDENVNVPSSDDAGTCSGSSDEAFDSGLTVDCWSTDITDPDDPPTLYEIVCRQWPPSCAGDPIDVVLATAGSICDSDQTKGRRPELSDVNVVATCPTSSVHMQFLDGVARGFACFRGDCEPIVPACNVGAGRVTCHFRPNRGW